jgi:hypothetical protein
MPVELLRWLVIAVVLYAAAAMLRAAALPKAPLVDATSPL